MPIQFMSIVEEKEALNNNDLGVLWVRINEVHFNRKITVKYRKIEQGLISFTI